MKQIRLSPLTIAVAVALAPTVFSSQAHAGYFNENVTLDKDTVIQTSHDQTTGHSAGLGVNQNATGKTITVNAQGQTLTVKTSEADRQSMQAAISALSSGNPYTDSKPLAGNLIVNANVSVDLNTDWDQPEGMRSVYAVRNTGGQTVTVNGDLSGRLTATHNAYVMAIDNQKYGSITNLNGKVNLTATAKDNLAYGLVSLGHPGGYNPNSGEVIDFNHTKMNFADTVSLTVEGLYSTGAQVGQSGEIHFRGASSSLTVKGNAAAGLDITNATGIVTYEKGSHTIHTELVAVNEEAGLINNVGVANRGTLTVGTGVDTFVINTVGVGTGTINLTAVNPDLQAVGLVTDWYQGTKPVEGKDYRAKTNLLAKKVLISVSDGSTAPGDGIVGGMLLGNGDLTTASQTQLTVNVETKSTGDVFGLKLLKGGMATLNGQTHIRVQASNAASAVGVAVGLGNSLTLNGNTTIDAAKALTGSGLVTTAGVLTANGTLDEFTGTMQIVDCGLVAYDEAVHKGFGGTWLLSGGTLQASEAYLFTNAGNLIDEDASKVVVDSKGVLNSQIAEGSGVLSVTDAGWYTTESLQAMGNFAAENGLSVSFINAQLFKPADENAPLVQGVIQEKETVDAKPDAMTATGAASITIKADTGAATVVVKPEQDKPVTSLELAAQTAGSDKQFVLVGTVPGGNLVTDEAGQALDVTVGKDVTLSLGSIAEGAEQTKGDLSKVVLADGADMGVSRIEANVEHLETQGTNLVSVGNNLSRGSLHTQVLKLHANSIIFVDPAWSTDDAQNIIERASHFAVTDTQASVLGGTIVAGQNSVVALGATADQAVAAFNALSQANQLAWGKDGVQSALFIGAPVTIGGAVVADGSMAQLPAGWTPATSGVSVAAGSMLMVDQAGVGTQAVKGTVTLADGSTLGLVNASEGSFVLADTVTMDPAKVTMVTDNPFIGVAMGVDNKTVQTNLNATGGAGVLASTGVQTMTRRADLVMARTVADRTAIDQELKAGANLWVDVTGESYDVDALDNGGQFKADMGYGTFGADFALTDTMTAGVAMQYGKGSLRSPVSNVKNSIQNYGLTAYMTKSFGETKLVGELAYVQSDNEITASQSALNNDVDAQMYSVGLRAQYRWTAGNFQFVPSIGVRVSRLDTDAIQVGSVRVADQEQTLVQVPISLRINGVDQQLQGWWVAPSFELAYIPTFGDKDVDILGIDQDVINTNTVQGEFGIRAVHGNMMLNAGLLAGGGEDGTSNVGGKIGLKYVF